MCIIWCIYHYSFSYVYLNVTDVKAVIFIVNNDHIDLFYNRGYFLLSFLSFLLLDRLSLSFLLNWSVKWKMQVILWENFPCLFHKKNLHNVMKSGQAGIIIILY